jgi:hypothetical protein
LKLTVLYIQNNEFESILKDIKEYGYKIDIIGTDCCKMAMLEIMYQLKNCTDYFIGSQNCEIADGWNYFEIFNNINENTSLEDFSFIAVNTYNNYCQKHAYEGLYTLSSINLNKIDRIVENLNKISSILINMINQDNLIKNVIKNARARSAFICNSPYYTDLYSFYDELIFELNKIDQRQEQNYLIGILNEGKTLIADAIVANYFGKNISKVKGISIYFPKAVIDRSYSYSSFAKETNWPNFLNKFLN